MNKRLLRLLNFCATLFLPLALLPPLVIFYAAVTGMNGAVLPLGTGELFLQLAVCALCGFAGRFCGQATDRWGLSSAVRRILSVPVGLAVGAGVWFLFAQIDASAALGAAVLSAVSFWVVGGLRFYAYGEILSLRVFYIYLAEYAIVLTFLQLFQIRVTDAAPFAAALFAALLLVLFGSNQAGIDYMMERRHHRFDAMPQKIRSYNIRLFAITAAGLLALLLLYRPISWLISAAGEGLLAVVRFLFRLFYRDGQEEGEDEPQPPMQQPEGMGQFEKGESSPFWTYFGIAVAIGALYLLYYYREEIAAGLRSSWQKLLDLIHRLLWGGRQRSDCDETEYYTETDEKIRSDESDVQETASLSDRRKWRRACRRFAAAQDSPQTMRAGYRLILDGIALRGVPVAASDTTLEICRNALRDGLPPIEACTASYNSLRYGEREFELASMQEIRTALSELLRYKK